MKLFCQSMLNLLNPNKTQSSTFTFELFGVWVEKGCFDVFVPCSLQCNVSTYQAARLGIPEGDGGPVQHQDLDPAHAEPHHGAVQEQQPGHRGGERGGQARHQPQAACGL